MGNQVDVKEIKKMKKALLWGAALCAMLVFMGCPVDEDPGKETPDGPKTPTGWAKGIENFTVTATDNPGEITYSFTAAEVADGTITYTLYYAEGSKYTASSIITAATAGTTETKVEPSDTGTVINAVPGRTYSLVIEASSGTLTKAYSAVEIVTTKAAPPPPPGGKSLTVTGIPSSASIDLAVLIEDIASFFDDDVAPVAGGLNNGGTFVLLTVDETTGQPNYDEAWTGTGEYYIMLVSQTAQKMYVYTNGGNFPDGVTTYDFTQTASTIAWNQFKELDLGSGSEEGFTLAVTDIPQGTVISGASLLDPETGASVAVGMNVGGTFTFFYPGDSFPIDFDSPFNTPGSYIIGLAEVDSAFQPITVYIYVGSAEGTQQTPLSFPTQQSIPWSHFKPQDGTERPQPVDQLTLTVTGIPTETTIFAAALFEDLADLETPMESAAAYGLNANGNFSFNHIPSGAFTELGEYYVALTTGMPGMPGVTNHLYVGSSGSTPVKYDFAQLTGNSIAWAQFAEYDGQQGQGETGDDPLTLTVTGIPQGTGIIAAILANPTNPQVPVALATDTGGSGAFTFYEPNMTNPTMPMPDPTKPFSTLGTYVLALATMTGQQYVYVGAGGTFTFTAATGNDLVWTAQTFVDSSQLGQQP
jgi:hypothetical protein